MEFSALNDFQSSLVLAKGGMGDPEREAQVHKWLSQFARIQDINRVLFELHTSGHFDYLEKSATFPLHEDPVVMMDEKMRLEAELRKWDTLVQDARDKHYFLNFLTTKQITRLMKQLREGSLQDPISTQPLFHSLRTMNRMLTMEKLQRTPVPVGLAGEQSIGEQLDACGSWLGQLLGDVPLADRKFPDDYVDAAKNNLLLDSDVSIDVKKVPDDLILTAYTYSGHLPEWPEFMICTADTTWEVLKCFLSRWKGAHRNGRSNRLYCLSKADKLEDSIQRKASQFLLRAERDGSREPLAKLLVVTCVDIGQSLI